MGNEHIYIEDNPRARSDSTVVHIQLYLPKLLVDLPENFGIRHSFASTGAVAWRHWGFRHFVKVDDACFVGTAPQVYHFVFLLVPLDVQCNSLGSAARSHSSACARGLVIALMHEVVAGHGVRHVPHNLHDFAKTDKDLIIPRGRRSASSSASFVDLAQCVDRTKRRHAATEPC